MPQVMTEKNRCRAFIGLGGNLGDPLTVFRDARRQLQLHREIDVIASSALYRTSPVGGPPDQPDYLNAVVELLLGLSPLELFDICLDLEQRAGRKRTEHWGARTLDIDLLFVGDQLSSTPRLMLPHPRLHQRHFVLQPLHDLAPDLIHPQLDLSIAELLLALPLTAGVTRIQDVW